MNIKRLFMLAILPALGASAADEPVLRYIESSTLNLEMEQEIFVGDKPDAIAGRSLTLSFEMSAPSDAGDVDVRVTSAKGSYEAHGMAQRLPASHLKGEQFVLLSDGVSMSSDGSGGKLSVGTIDGDGLQLSALLVSLMPDLPADTITEGVDWSSSLEFRSLQGWAWAQGVIEYSHKVVNVSESDDAVIVEVRSKGESTLTTADGNDVYVGEGYVSQTMEWRFDASSGRLIDVSLNQQATGTNVMPRGEVPFRQTTRITMHGS